MGRAAELQKMETTASPTSRTWLLLGIAVIFEIAGAIGLGFSEGFSLIGPTLAALAAFAVALYLVSRVMKTLPVSIAYPVWAGGGTAGVALIGVLALGEELNRLCLESGGNSLATFSEHVNLGLIRPRGQG